MLARQARPLRGLCLARCRSRESARGRPGGEPDRLRGRGGFRSHDARLGRRAPRRLGNSGLAGPVVNGGRLPREPLLATPAACSPCEVLTCADVLSVLTGWCGRGWRLEPRRLRMCLIPERQRTGDRLERLPLGRDAPHPGDDRRGEHQGRAEEIAAEDAQPRAGSRPAPRRGPGRRRRRCRCRWRRRARWRAPGSRAGRSR